MTNKPFTLPSPYDNLPLAGYIVEPDCAPKGIVQFVHGMAEHKGRYEDVSAFFAEKGYVAVCHDHRGHGESIQKMEDLGYFGDKSGKAVVEDTVAVSKYVKELYPNIPLILVGHSMGSMIVRCYIQKNDGLCDKLVVCGSPSRNRLAGVAILLTKCIALVRGKRHRSKLLKYLSTGKGAKRFAAEGRGGWLSTNRANIEKYIQDEKCGYRFTCNGNENLFRLMKNTYKKRAYKVSNPDLPIHFIAGGDDPVIVNEVKWAQAIAFLKKAGYTQVSGKLYEGKRHEILNEIGREEVYDDLLNFIEGEPAQKTE